MGVLGACTCIYIRTLFVGVRFDDIELVFAVDRNADVLSSCFGIQCQNPLYALKMAVPNDLKIYNNSLHSSQNLNQIVQDHQSTLQCITAQMQVLVDKSLVL